MGAHSHAISSFLLLLPGPGSQVLAGVDFCRQVPPQVVTFAQDMVPTVAKPLLDYKYRVTFGKCNLVGAWLSFASDSYFLVHLVRVAGGHPRIIGLRPPFGIVKTHFHREIFILGSRGIVFGLGTEVNGPDATLSADSIDFGFDA